MLNITGMNKFYYIRNFTDMRCKYSRILAVIRHQLGREPQKDEVFIVMSKNRRLVRLFSFDRISFSLYEKRFAQEYQFMKVVRDGDELTYKIDWKDVVLLLESPTRKRLSERNSAHSSSITVPFVCIP